MYQTYEKHGEKAALKQLARDGVITVVAGATGKLVYSVGGKVIKTKNVAKKVAKEKQALQNIGQKQNSRRKVNDRINRRPESKEFIAKLNENKQFNQKINELKQITDFKSKAPDSGVGMKFEKIINGKVLEIRFMKGTPKASQKGQQKDYVSINHGRKGINFDKNLNRVEKQSRESHISIDEFLKIDMKKLENFIKELK